MFTKNAGRSFLVLAVIMLGNITLNSLAADEANERGLDKALGQVKLFSGLTNEERDAIKSAASLRSGKAGERIIEEGKKLDRMFIVMEGGTEVWLKGKCIATHPGQDLVGEFEFLDMGPAIANIILVKDTDIIELNYASLYDLIEKQPRLGCNLMREIAKAEIRRLLEKNTK